MCRLRGTLRERVTDISELQVSVVVAECRAPVIVTVASGSFTLRLMRQCIWHALLGYLVSHLSSVDARFRWKFDSSCWYARAQRIALGLRVYQVRCGGSEIREEHNYFGVLSRQTKNKDRCDCRSIDFMEAYYFCCVRSSKITQFPKHEIQILHRDDVRTSQSRCQPVPVEGVRCSKKKRIHLQP